MCNVRATYKVTFYVTRSSNQKYMKVWKCEKSIPKKNENKLKIMFDRDLKSWKILMMHRFEKSSLEKYSVYTLTKNPIQCISPKFFTCFSKGCYHVWVAANPMKILLIITVSYLIKISSIKVIFVFAFWWQRQ